MELANPFYKIQIVHAGAPKTSLVWADFAVVRCLRVFQAAAQYLLQISEIGMDLL